MKHNKLLEAIWRQRIFILFITVAALLWYINKLSHQYTNDVTIAVRLVPDYGSDVFVDDSFKFVRCNVQSDGRLLMLYNWGGAPPVEIPISALEMTQVSPYRCKIDVGSLQMAIQSRLTDTKINTIIDNELEVTVSTIVSRRVAVESRIDINCRRQFMVEGQLHIAPDSVDIKAPQVVLDTLRAITTEQIELDDVFRSVSGVADLMVPTNVVCKIQSVKYGARIEAYTEMEYQLPIIAHGIKFGQQCVVVPKQCDVLVKIPMASCRNDIKPQASIDCRTPDLFAAIAIDSLPKGAQVVKIEPSFVEFFITKQ